MAKVTRIKASDPGKDETAGKGPSKVTKVSSKTAKTSKKSSAKSAKTGVSATKTKVVTTTENSKVAKAAKATKTAKTTKATTTAKNTKKPFILIRPFVYFGRYVKESWQEIRQVRWPSRKTTWKLFLAILVYTLIFAVVIMLLDILFSWLFNTVIGK